MTAPASSSGTNIIAPGDVINERDLPPRVLRDDDDDDDDPSSAVAAPLESWLDTIDVILLLGGGVPHSPNEPPAYVRRRCDVVARLMRTRTGRRGGGGDERGRRRREDMSVICLSAGTAHLPQYVLRGDGLPLWESTASASYLMSHPVYPVHADRIYVETASYDTISNAFFARTVFTDVVNDAVDRREDDDDDDDDDDNGSDGGGRRTSGCGVRSWRRILVVTNEFHVRRTKAIFDWVFGAPISSSRSTHSPPRSDNGGYYELYYLSCDDVGLDDGAIRARRSHEARGERNVVENLSRKYVTLRDIWEFLVKEHDFYSARGLVARANATMSGIDAVGGSSDALKLSYGMSSKSNGGDDDTDNDDEGMGGYERSSNKTLEYVNGRISLKIDASPLAVAAAMTTLLMALAVVVVVVVGGGKTRGR